MLLCLHCACEVGSSPFIDTEEDEDAFLSELYQTQFQRCNEGNVLEYDIKKGKGGKDAFYNQSHLETFCS